MTRWSYTVPSGKKCYVDTLFARLNVQARRTAAGFHGVVVTLSSFAASMDLVRVEVYENTYGAGEKAELANVGSIGAGDNLFGSDFGASTGDYNVYVSAKMTEFDA